MRGIATQLDVPTTVVQKSLKTSKRNIDGSLSQISRLEM